MLGTWEILGGPGTLRKRMAWIRTPYKDGLGTQMTRLASPDRVDGLGAQMTLMFYRTGDVFVGKDLHLIGQNGCTSALSSGSPCFSALALI